MKHQEEEEAGVKAEDEDLGLGNRPRRSRISGWIPTRLFFFITENVKSTIRVKHAEY